MANKPLVSVIIPCYNVSAYIEQSLLSVIRQTYFNLEIIVVDDASTDDTLTVIKNIRDNRLKIVELKENTKKIGAVNYALSIVSGDYIAFQDADDISDLSRIEKQVAILNHDESLGICFTNYRYNKETYKKRVIALSDNQLKDEFLKFGYRVYTGLEPTMCATMMIRSHVLNDCPGYHTYFTGRVAEDIYWVYCILRKFKGTTLDEHLYNINLRTGSLTDSQVKGHNAKAAYTWQLLAKIIKISQEQGIDVLSPEHAELLKALELEACEDALAAQMRLNHNLKQTYEQSTSLKLGKAILKPFHFFKKKI